VSSEPRALPDHVGRLAMIARWKPVHAGHAAVLEALAERADHVILGIGSANRYNARNPFTAAETATMIRLVPGGREAAALVEVPDLDDGPRWRLMVKEMLGPLDLFVTANAYVRSLLLEDYPILHPVHLVPPERRVRVDGSMVRAAMARGEGWRALVPPEIARFLDEQGLVRRFRAEFGAETLSLARTE
jgi:nicotinamide-nucleotide adenylyltransferase